MLLLPLLLIMIIIVMIILIVIMRTVIIRSNTRLRHAPHRRQPRFRSMLVAPLSRLFVCLLYVRSLVICLMCWSLIVWPFSRLDVWLNYMVPAGSGIKRFGSVRLVLFGFLLLPGYASLRVWLDCLPTYYSIINIISDALRCAFRYYACHTWNTYSCIVCHTVFLRSCVQTCINVSTACV